MPENYLRRLRFTKVGCIYIMPDGRELEHGDEIETTEPERWTESGLFELCDTAAWAADEEE